MVQKDRQNFKKIFNKGITNDVEIESNWNLNPNLVAEMFGIDLNIFYHVVHVHDSMRVTIGHKFSCKYYFKNLSLQKVSET